MRNEHIAKNINIGLDFDGVLAHGINAKIRYAKKWFGVNLKYSQTKKSGFNNLMKQLGKNVNYRDLMDKLNEEHILEYEIPEECVNILRRLYSEGFRFAIITSRNKHDYPYAKMFVKHNFSSIIKYIHNTRDEPKDVFVQKLRIRAHVDDDLKKLTELENTPAQLVYYRQLENKGINIPISRKLSILHLSRFHEIKSWQEFYELMHMIKEMHEAICWKHGMRNDSFRLKDMDYLCRNLGKRKIKSIIWEYRKAKAWH